MNERVIELSLDLNCKTSGPVVHLTQFDKGVSIHLSAYLDGSFFSLSGTTVVLKGIDARKGQVLLECQVNADGTATATTLDSTFSEDGVAVCKFVISDSTKTYATQTFLVDVDDSLDAEIHDDRYSLLGEMIRKILLMDEQGGILVDEELDPTSKHPVQNKVIYEVLSHLAEYVNNATVDNATETGKVYYTTVGSSKALIVPVSGDSSQVQFRIDHDGKIYARRRSRSSTTVDFPSWGIFEQIGWTSAEIGAMIDSLVDSTLSVQGKAADALVVGERIHGNDRRLSVLLENHEATYIPKDGTHAGTVLPMNGRISLSGAYEATAFSSSSDFIPVTPLLTIVPHCYGHQSFLSVAFYNANKEFISGVGVQASWERVPQDIDIPAGAAYYRLCEMVADSGGYIDVSYVTRESTKELAAHKAAEDAEFLQVNSRIEDVEQELTASSHVAVADVTGQSGFVDASGVFNSSASWVVTDYMSTKTLLSLTEHVRVYSGRPNVVFYDKYKVFISANVPDTSAVIDAVIVPPDNAYYFRLNFFVGDTAQYYDLTIDKLAASAIETANKCDPLFGKKIGAVGDSITIGTYSVPGNTYVNQIANAHGMTVNNAAVWGSIFPTGKTENNAPRGSIFSQIATLDNDCDIIIISGGINDAEYYSDDTYWGQVSGGYEAELDPATFCGAFEGTLKMALNKFPGKPIIFVFEHRMTQPYQSIYGQHFENMQLPLMLEMLKKWGIPYVDLFHETPSITYTPGYIALYSFDNKGVHPNIAGYRKFYTPHVESAIQAIAK